jgi:hypothetical protein
VTSFSAVAGSTLADWGALAHAASCRNGARCGGGSVTAEVMDRPALIRRGKLLEYATVGYNSLEGTIAIGAGLIAGSVALVGVCFDSAI